jgi:hypothetical protein
MMHKRFQRLPHRHVSLVFHWLAVVLNIDVDKGGILPMASGTNYQGSASD